MCLYNLINEKSKAEIKKEKKSNLRLLFAFPFHIALLFSLSSPSTLWLPSFLPTPHHFPVDSHNTRRACSLLFSPEMREGWSTAQVMRALLSLRLTFRVSSLLTLYVGSSGTDFTTARRPEVKRDKEREGAVKRGIRDYKGNSTV